MKRLFIITVYFYKKYISPLIGKNCIYQPTCSTYMIEAINKYGAIKGTLLGIKRLLRCNPFSKGGFDPVPNNYKGKTKWVI